jgi:two-component system, OmpR family, sensor kinase
VLSRVPLRVRLVAALVLLVLVALVTTGVVAATQLRGYLLDRTDAQLRSASHSIVERIEHGGDYFGPEQGGSELAGAFYVQLANANGQPVQALRDPQHAHKPAPDFPTFTRHALEERAGRPFTVHSLRGDDRWRVDVTALPGGSGSVAVAVGLDDVDSTVRRLASINLIVGLLALALLAGLGYWLVRSSLRPLVEVERTAGEIAAGQLSQRVPEHDPRTEVGRLTRSLNTMLGQIEAAFRDRAASERHARASEERMRRFVADASHELRTPLTSIRGFAELYRQGAAGSPEDVSRMMRRIEDEAARMGLLVEDLLLLARLDEQRPLVMHAVDLLTLATDAVHDARATAPARAIDLQVTADDAAPMVLGDEARLRQVLGNLVSNALAHTPDGTPVTVRLTTAAGADESPSATLEVVDHGPGLEPDEAARVFERFYQADPSRSRLPGTPARGATAGAGLGLSIVAALVAAHGGVVEVSSVPGKGATFRVRLPLAAQPAPGVHAG